MYFSGFGIEDEYGEPYNPDEDLNPLQKLEKYAFSDNIYSRLVDKYVFVRQLEPFTAEICFESFQL